MNCPLCNSPNIARSGSDLLASGRAERMKCRNCTKRFRTGRLRPLTLREGYWDIETSQAGRGAGTFGIIYSYVIKERGRETYYGAHLDHHTLKAERRVVEKMLRDLRRFDRVYTYWGTGHDAPVGRTRAEFHGLDFPAYGEVEHKDLYYSVRGKFAFHSNRLAVVAEFFGVSTKTRVDPAIWARASLGDLEAVRKYIYPHNVEDVNTLEKVHERIEKYGLSNGGRSL